MTHYSNHLLLTNTAITQDWDDHLTQSIVKAVCTDYGVEYDTLKNKINRQILVRTRQMIYYFLCKYTKRSWTSIAKVFNQDHSTAMHGMRTVIATYKSCKRTQKAVKCVESHLLQKGTLKAILGLEEVLYKKTQDDNDQVRDGKGWTNSELTIMLRMYRKFTVEKIANALNRSHENVTDKIKRLELNSIFPTLDEMNAA